ncbi:hypothetical protein D931_02266 [Enterococcus faecium 13.SD.W.09]|nr:hypothetical protein D931_02266 [Enterococcus faecium 13.SD.W.09]
MDTWKVLLRCSTWIIWIHSLSFDKRDKKSIRNRILATSWSKRTWLGQRFVSQTKVGTV